MFWTGLQVVSLPVQFWFALQMGVAAGEGRGALAVATGLMLLYNVASLYGGRRAGY